MDVIDKYKVILGSEPEISYYFYGFRKLGQDMKHRILANRFGSAREMAIERFMKEEEFIKSHRIKDDVTERAPAVFYPDIC